jgi:hypothetical protein
VNSRTTRWVAAACAASVQVFAALVRPRTASYRYSEPTFKPIVAFTRNGTPGLAELVNVALDRSC